MFERGQEMNEKHLVKVVWAVKALLVVVLIYAGFQAIIGRVYLGKVLDPDTVSGEERTPDEQAATTPGSPRDYSAIIQRNLFTGPDRLALQTGPSRSQMLDSLPSAEELGLKLIGTIAGNPAVSRAIIQNARNNTISDYRIGDVVASATVESIQREAVIVRHQGRQLVLRQHTGTGANNQGDSQPSGEESGSMSAAPRQGAAVPLSTQAGYVEEVFRKVEIEPYVKNNQTQGLKVSGLEKVPMAELFGLKNDDVIQTINGQQLTSKQKAFQVLMKAKSQSRIDIQLLRDGKSKDLSFEI